MEKVSFLKKPLKSGRKKLLKYIEILEKRRFSGNFESLGEWLIPLLFLLTVNEISVALSKLVKKVLKNYDQVESNG